MLRNCPEIRIESVKVLLFSFAVRRIVVVVLCFRASDTGLIENWFAVCRANQGRKCQLSESLAEAGKRLIVIEE